MRAIISNSLLKQVKPGNEPIEIRDDQIKGLVLRIQPTGLMTYYVEYDRGKRMKLGRHPVMTPAQAREMAKQTLGQVYQGADPMAAKRRAKANSYISFIDELYKPWAETHLRSYKNTIGRLRSNFRDFHNFKLHEITPWIVEKWRSARMKAGLKTSTINRDISDLKSCLSKAVQWGLIDDHPIKAVKKSREDILASPRFLSEKEEIRLRECLDVREEELRLQRDRYNQWRNQRHLKPISNLRQYTFADHLKPLVLLSLNTGMRRGELFNLRWNAIDFSNELLTIHGDKAKSGKTRHIPLNSEALSILRQWKEQCGIDCGNAVVFPGKDGKPLDNVNKSWWSLLEMAGIDDFRWHDMRHTFASNLVMAGVDLNTVRELLGHSDYKMTLRYAHLAPKHKANAVARLVRSNG